ncbi:MAG TPA: DUF1553 domain-containing protein [Urbifossiella sp.]
MQRVGLGCAALCGILIAFSSQTARAQDKRPEPAPAARGLSPQTRKINEFIRQGYEAAGIEKTAARAADHVFLRRLFIDVIGRIPTPEEIIDFECDALADRRWNLIRRLLGSKPYMLKDRNDLPYTISRPNSNGKPRFLTKNYAEEFAEHWANIWTVRLMTRHVHPVYWGQMHAWLKDQFSATPARAAASHKEMVVKLLTATGQVGGAEIGPAKPEYAANFILHHLGEPLSDCMDGAYDAIPITSRVTRLFLGLQTECMQCHDHPLDKEWVQADFWGVNAFFRQTVRSGIPSPVPNEENGGDNSYAAPLELTDEGNYNPGMIIYFERRDGRLVGSYPTMLKEYAQAQAGAKSSKILVAAPNKTRRRQLAEWVVAHDNFSRSYVNQMWAHFFGRGLNREPAADDFGGNNEIVHAELLDYLATQFAAADYDPKRLMEWIVASDAYQLGYIGAKESLDPKFDAYFARMPMKPMAPEVLFESLMTATSTTAERMNLAAAKSRRNSRAAWRQKLIQQFGQSETNDFRSNYTIVQSLMMINGSELNNEIGVRQAGAVIQEMVRKNRTNPMGMYDDLFLSALSRYPTKDEVKHLEEVRSGINSASSKPRLAKDSAVIVHSDLAFYQDLLWALLNASEFAINH